MTLIPVPETGMSPFMETQVKRLMLRFSLSYIREDTCLEYFLQDPQKQSLVSLNLILSHDRFARGLYVSKFYPRLFLFKDHRFLSAACFYMMVHHSVGVFGLADHCRVSLETDTSVFDEFYSRLPEFHFKIAYQRPCRRVCLYGSYDRLPIDTTIIEENRKMFL
ncbi:MAG: hypothetical protein RQ739_00010 [Desulfotignum sp.]|nr:hypothetical protein [Desulfotignum sp.]